MEEKLFSNPGEKLKLFAKIFFIVQALGVFILAIVFGRYSFSPGCDFNYLNFLILLVGGAVVTYLNALLLYGFGELISRTSDTDDSVYSIGSSVKGLEMEVDALVKKVEALQGSDSASN